MEGNELRVMTLKAQVKRCWPRHRESHKVSCTAPALACRWLENLSRRLIEISEDPVPASAADWYISKMATVAGRPHTTLHQFPIFPHLSSHLIHKLITVKNARVNEDAKPYVWFPPSRICPVASHWLGLSGAAAFTFMLSNLWIAGMGYLLHSDKCFQVSFFLASHI